MTITMSCKKCGCEKPMYEFFRGETCLQGYFDYCHTCIQKALDMYLFEEST